MSKDYYLYGLGAALVDTEIQVTDTDLQQLAVAKGVMTLVDQARQAQLTQELSGHLVHSKRASGGSGANSMIAAAYLGSKVFYSCKVANDDNGQFFLQDIRAAGVEHPLDLGSQAGVTGKCLVFITPDAERTMNTFLGISEQLSEAELQPEILKRSQWLYIEGYQVTSATGRAAAVKAREIAQQNNVKVALSLSDPAMVQFFREGLLEMLGQQVELLFCNEHEAIGFTQADNLEQAAERLKQYGKQLAITLGAEGALLFDGQDWHRVASPRVQAVDTNGAGDMFAGAYLHALGLGLDAKAAGSFATQAAAMVVAQFGPRLAPEQYQTLLDLLQQ